MNAVMEKPKVFVMLRPTAGDVVLHRRTRGAEAAIALVIEVFERTVTLHVIAPHVYNMTPMAAVRHIDDPDVSLEHEGGFWEFRLKDLEMQKRITALEVLAAQKK